MKFMSNMKELNVCVRTGVRSNVNGIDYTDPGVYVQFSDFCFETEDPTVIDGMTRHPQFAQNGLLDQIKLFTTVGASVPQQPKQEAKTFDCDKCSFKAKDQDGLALHQMSHKKRRAAATVEA